MVAHFEFLITSEYKVPTNIFPTLPLWSTIMLRSFIALDTMRGMSPNFGRLQGKIVTNSIPTMESYVDDAMSLFGSSITLEDIKKFAPPTFPVLTPMQLDNIASKPAETSSIQENIPLGKQPNLQRILNSFEFLDFPGPHIYPPSFYPECRNSLYCPFKINYVESEIIVATPLNDLRLIKLMEDYEAECRRNGFQVENKNKYEHFCPTKLVQQSNYMQFQQVIFSSPVQAEFYKIMTAALPVLDSRYFFRHVHLPCFVDKQWIVITTNLESRRFFDIMNPDASGKDKFTSIISTVCYKFKSLFALTYPNCTAFAMKDFNYRFIAVPRTHFRYDRGVFILQILKTYRGMGVLGFRTVILQHVDLQALREIFLYEIATYNNTEVQLPIVTTFLQNHGFRSFK
ncbi:hypothetical protein ZWY2020_022789 [Hordeum vulgare]|nr:hypothetical protein ZWY2020_022789 [Hordeum vulgare]